MPRCASRPLFALVLPLLLAACGPQVATIELEPAQATLTAPGQTLPLRAAAKNARGEPQGEVALVWSSSAPAVATVAPDGVVTAVSSGEAVISASHKARVSGTAKVRVSLPHALLVSPDRVRLAGIGGRARISARVIDSNGNDVPGARVEWEVENPEIVSVVDGELTSVGVGDGRAVAVHGGIRAPVLVQVQEPPVAAIEVTPSPVEARLRRELKLTVSALDPEGAPLPGAKFHYFVEDPSVATVDETGVVSPVKPGRTKLRVRSAGAETVVELSVRR